MEESIFQSGRFFVGCNYWASHAGTAMWHNWNAESVENDLRLLSESGVQVMRVFPLWPDFQPLKMHRKYAQQDCEIRMGEEPLPDTEAGQAGMDETMLQRFETFLNLAQKYRLKLIVGLLTGWMSGRMFVPEMFDGLNVLTDPVAIEWEIKFVRCFVRRFKSHPAIAAWDLGNECNCMGISPSRASFYCWMAAISMAIRVEDASRPVVSGMHGIRLESIKPPRDQGELLDVLTTHPYPLFTPHCDTDPINQMKSALHATAESRYYADLSGKLCFAEEVGSLGPMICSEENAADYARASMLTLWAHNCMGFLWWCAFEQIALTTTPYEWCAVERELGLFHLDKTPKPIMNALRDISKFIAGTGIDRLPDNITDAVCVLTEGQDTWVTAYGSFLLAKRAHLDIRFADGAHTLPNAPVYLLPSVKGLTSMGRRNWFTLIERVKEGAVLYLSLDDCMLSPFAELTGLQVLTRSKNTVPDTVQMDGKAYSLFAPYRLRTASRGAETLAVNQYGDPVFTKFRLGKGLVYCLLYPLESIAATAPGAVDGENCQAWDAFYQKLSVVSPLRAASLDNPTVGMTEHIVNNREHLLVTVNYEPETQSAILTLKAGWSVKDFHPTDKDASWNMSGAITLPHNSGAVIRICADV